MADDEERENMKELEELRYMQQVYQSQYAALNNSMNMHMQDVQALSAVQNTLENSDMMKGKETLMHAGASVYLKAEIQDASRVLVSIGGGYLIEKSVEDAKGYVSKLITKKTEMLNNMAKSRKELQGAIIDISYRMERDAR